MFDLLELDGAVLGGLQAQQLADHVDRKRGLAVADKEDDLLKLLHGSQGQRLSCFTVGDNKNAIGHRCILP